MVTEQKEHHARLEVLMVESERRVLQAELHPKDVGWHDTAELMLMRTRSEMIRIGEYSAASPYKKQWVELVTRLNKVRYPSNT